MDVGQFVPLHRLPRDRARDPEGGRELSFEYHEPASWADAQALLSRHGMDATVLAGGTAFTLLLRQGLIRPVAAVSLRRIPDASAIRADAHGGLSIGAMATHTDAVRSATVRAAWPELAGALAKVATPRIRNQATVGGSLAHADPASDAPAMLAALAAQVVVVGAGGARRRVPVDELFADTFTTTLAPDELVHSIEIAGRQPSTRAAYLKFTLRSVDDYATVSVGATADVAGGLVRDVRVFLGGVGATPMRGASVEAALCGTRADTRALAEAAALVRGDVDPIDDVRGSAGYKREMARVFTERALRAVIA